MSGDSSSTESSEHSEKDSESSEDENFEESGNSESKPKPNPFDNIRKIISEPDEEEKSKMIKNLKKFSDTLPVPTEKNNITSLINEIRTSIEDEEKLDLIKQLTNLVDNDTYFILYKLPEEEEVRMYYLNKKSIAQIFLMFLAAQQDNNFAVSLSDYKTHLFDKGEGNVIVETIVKINYDKNSTLTDRVNKVWNSLKEFKNTHSNESRLKLIKKVLKALASSIFSITYKKDESIHYVILDHKGAVMIEEFLKGEKNLIIPDLIKTLFFDINIEINNVVKIVTKPKSSSTKPKSSSTNPNPSRKLQRPIHTVPKKLAELKNVEVYVPFKSSGKSESFYLFSSTGPILLTISYKHINIPMK